MAHDSDYCRQQAELARVAAARRDTTENSEVAGHLALAYATLARRRAALADPAAVSAPDPEPMLLRD
ncbi:hypothetical protein [Sphingomonas sp.]|uniref:hypothetical protein n=1 Tax=Sphingomonas sp. TaxID=28214 RepID=UPI00286DBCB5|nr:hypothetical protein [Sphingomonas sp.]